MAIQTIPAASAGGANLEPYYQKFTTSGTFTLPTGYGVSKPLLVNIQVIGGGGGGSSNAIAAYNVDYTNYFGTGSFNIAARNDAGRAGGSGGIAATQMYLTSNLTITIGAAGTRATAQVGAGASQTGNQGSNYNFSGSVTAGSGGTTTAGSVQSTGGVGANSAFNYAIGQNGANSTAVNSSVGTGGTPAGTAGAATPLLGTIAGGSNDTTPVRGSFGIGGISTDTTTSTGVEGTGGGNASVGASGAVVLTWWQ